MWRRTKPGKRLESRTDRTRFASIIRRRRPRARWSAETAEKTRPCSEHSDFCAALSHEAGDGDPDHRIRVRSAASGPYQRGCRLRRAPPCGVRTRRGGLPPIPSSGSSPRHGEAGARTTTPTHCTTGRPMTRYQGGVRLAQRGWRCHSQRAEFVHGPKKTIPERPAGSRSPRQNTRRRANGLYLGKCVCLTTSRRRPGPNDH